MRSIINHPQVMLLSYSINLLDFAGITENMYGKNCTSMFSDLFLNLRRVHIQCLWININKDRRTTLPNNGADCSDESKRSSNDLAFKPQGTDSHMNGNSTIGH